VHTPTALALGKVVGLLEALPAEVLARGYVTRQAASGAFRLHQGATEAAAAVGLALVAALGVAGTAPVTGTKVNTEIGCISSEATAGVIADTSVRYAVTQAECHSSPRSHSFLNSNFGPQFFLGVKHGDEVAELHNFGIFSFLGRNAKSHLKDQLTGHVGTRGHNINYLDVEVRWAGLGTVLPTQ